MTSAAVASLFLLALPTGKTATNPSADHQCRTTSGVLISCGKLAAKRLRIIARSEHRIVRLMVTIHRLRGGDACAVSARSCSSSAGAKQRVSRASRIAHESGWLCIHSREGAWNANTGNGFYGGLQMTYGWMGLVRRADLLSPAQQMQAAETGYRHSGYSDSWMRGQWPNTYPPCAGLFG